MGKKFLLIFILIFISIVNVKAVTILKEDVNPSTYIVGKYMFTRNVNDNYDGKLTTQRIMLASRTISENQESNMVIYYKKANGSWIDALTSEEIVVPDTLELEVIDMNGSPSEVTLLPGAIDYTNVEIAPTTYVIGQYMFTRNISDNYDGKLTTKRIMLAAKSIIGSSISDMVIYYKKPNGTWINALNNTSVVLPDTFKIGNVDLVPKTEDTTAPTCVFEATSVMDAASSGLLILRCTDESGISTSTLTSSAFTFDDSLTISSIETSNITNGKEYRITILASTNGAFNISLNSDVITDYSNNTASSVSTTASFKKTYTVTFNANNGSDDNKTLFCTAFENPTCDIVLPDNDFTYTDWIFSGWGDTKASTSGTMPATTIAISSDESMYAIWSKSVLVLFEANSCTSMSMASTMTLYNGSTSGEIIVPTVEILEGWSSLGASANPVSTTPGVAMGETMVINDIAQSATTAVRYYNCGQFETKVLTLFANNGTEESISRSCNIYSYNGEAEDGCTVVLPENEYTYEGWTFNGWGTSSSSTSGLSADTTITLTDDLAYYATWEKVVTVLFNNNGCAVSDAWGSLTLHNGENSGTVEVPTRAMNSGWVSLGISENENSTTQGIEMGSDMVISEISATTDSILRYYNCNKLETLTLTLDANGGIGDELSRSCDITRYNGLSEEISCSVELPENEYTYTGWTFNGWGTSQIDTSGLESGIELSLTSNKTYYATWKKEIAVLFNANGCTDADATVDIQFYNGETSSSVVVPNKTMNSGWTSLGASYYANSTIMGTPINSRMTVSVNSSSTENVNLYYNCSRTIARTLTLDANNGTGETATRACNITVYNGITTGNCSVPLPTNSFTYDGFKFNGWSPIASATEGTSPGQSITLYADTTRYATWKEITYTIKVEALDLLNMSPDRNLVLYADGEKIEFNAIYYNDYKICDGTSSVVNIYELEGISQLEVELTTGTMVTATIVN